MGLFENFPYTNFQNLNLDWVLKQIQNLLATTKKIQVELEDLKNYVENMESEMSNQIKDILDEWLSDGTLENIIEGAIAPNWLYGKNIVVYGDSTAAISNNYFTKIASKVNTNITNRAISGTTLTQGSSQSAYDMISAANDLENFDMIFLAYGTNDWQLNRMLNNGRNGNYQCITNCMQYLIDTIYSKNPTIKIVFITPFYSYRASGGSNPPFTDGVKNGRGHALWMYNREIIAKCIENGVEYIDFYTTSGCNIDNYTYLLDNNSGAYVHENAIFSDILSDIVISRKSNTPPYKLNKNNKNLITPVHFSDIWPKTVDAITSVPDPYGYWPYAHVPTANTWTGLYGNITFSYGKYTIYGYAAGAFKLRIFSTVSSTAVFEKDITSAGYFETTFENTGDAFTGELQLSANQNNTFISCIHVVPDNPASEEGYYGTFGAAEPLVPAEGVTADSGYRSKIFITERQIQIGTFNFTLSAEKTYGSVLFSRRRTDGIPMQTFYCATSSHSTRYILYYADGKIYTAQNMPAGDYIMANTAINILSPFTI